MLKWSSDWTKAPKEKWFLCRLPPDETGARLITTAAFFWETAVGNVDGYDAQWWALQDMVRDCPLDDNGPPEDQNLEWMEIPE